MNIDQTNKCNCQCECTSKSKETKNGNSLVITWQRLIANGTTCPRCGSTEDELEKAIEVLKEKLKPSGINVVLNKIVLTLEEFKRDSIQSNRILFNDRVLEDIIGANIGKSSCCDVCGDEPCRTVKTNGATYETIPAEIIVQAGLKVAGDM